MTSKNYISILLIFLSAFSFSQNQKIIIATDTIRETVSNDRLVEAFGDSIESAIVNSQKEKAASLFSKKAFNRRLERQNPDFKKSDSYYQGILSGINQAAHQLSERIMADIENNGYYDFINYRYDEEAQTYFILFRLYSTSGINYHDYRILKDETTGALKYSDIYIYLSGEEFSESLGRLVKFALNAYNNKKIKTQEDTDFDNLQSGIVYNRNGEFKSAYKALQKIKGSLSKDKFFLILNTLVASNVDEKTYKKSLKELIETHADDPTIFLNKIDYYLLEGQYDDALKSIDLLKEKTQDDFLEFLKAGVYYEAEDYTKALESFKYIIDNYPGFFEAQSSYISLLAVLERNDEIVTYLDVMLEEYDKPDLIQYLEELDENDENVFEDFIKTDVYKTWKAKE